MTVPGPVLEWLSQQLAHEYVDPPRCFTDFTQVLLAIPSLVPKTDVYTSETGLPALLLNLTGPLPTVIAGQTYGIPIEVWIPKLYPSSPPLIYVRPTASMRIAPSDYVDTNGKCLFQWTLQTELIAVLRMLQEVFSFAPPVYAVQEVPQAATAPPQYTKQVVHPKPDPVPYKPIKDIMNSINDPVPLPANPAPQKVDALKHLEEALQAVSTQIRDEETAKDSQALQHANEVLDWMDQALDEEQGQLEAAKQQYETNIRLLNERIEQAEKITKAAKAHADKNLPLEELIYPETPNDMKVFNAATEDRAIGDTIHALGKVLDNEAIPIDVFIKNVRFLARQQFLARAEALNCI